MRILVTGATGFVGSNLIPALLEHGYEVLATCRDRSRADKVSGAGQVQWFDFDIFNPPDNPYAALGSPDRMIHLAWSGLPNYKDDFHLTENLPADEAFLKSMLDGGLEHLLVTGTCFEYGMQEGELDEECPPKPDNPYAKAKTLLRERLEAYIQGASKTLQWARLFYMFGPGQNAHSLFAQLQKAVDSEAKEFDMSGGQQIRDFLPISTIAEYLVAIVSQSEISGVVNVCSGRKVVLETLVKEFLAERNADLVLNLGKYPYPDWEPFRFWGSTVKLQAALEAAGRVVSD